MKKQFFLLAFIMAAFAGWSQDFSAVCSTGQTLYYTITSHSAPYTVKVDMPDEGYSPSITGVLNIPSTVSYEGIDYTVKAIGIGAFYNCTGLTEVVIPSTVTVIDENAFYRCNHLTAAHLPNSIDSIRRHAFSQCSALANLTMPNAIRFIGESAFNQCASLQGEIVIPNTVTYLGESAFYQCRAITRLTLSNSLTRIEDHVFNECSGIEGTVTIPEGVTSIGVEAFYGCSNITRVLLPESLTHIHTGAFDGCSSMTGTLTIPNAVTDIDEMAFNECRHLTGIRLSYSLTTIGYAAFCGCRSVVRLDIPANVTTIERYAFAECERLTWITFPRALSSLGDAVFTQCYRLQGITCYATTPPSLGRYVFDQVDTSLQILVPCDCIEAYQAHPVWGAFSNYGEVFGASLVVESINENFGTVSISQYPTCYDHTATFRASAKHGYHFVRWNDGNTDAVRSVEVNEDVIYTALFENNGNPQAIEPTEESQSIVTSLRGNIIVKNTESQIISIYDLAGRTLYCQQTDNLTFRVPHTGIYLVRIGNSKTHKLMVL